MTRVGILAMAQQRHGGTLPYTRSMIEALKALPPAQVSLRLFTAADNPEYDALGLPIERLPGAGAIVASRFTGRDLFAQVDIVIAPIYSTVLLATRRPFAFTLHDLQEKYFPENFSLAIRLWRHATNRLLTRRAKRIVCESSFVRDDIVKYFGVPAARIAVLPAPPVALMRASDVSAAQVELARARFDLPGSYVLYAAQFWPHKNHLRLVRAFAQAAADLPECVLVLTGKPRDEYERVMALVRELGLQQRVRHIGYVESADLAALYKGATLVAVPTLFESISIPVYEAFSMGTPVCASAVVALPEQIGDAGLLFDPLSVGDMAAKIRRLLLEPALRADLAGRGQRRMQSMTAAGYTQRLGELIAALQSAGRG